MEYEEKTVILNGKKLNEDEFKLKKVEVANKKGVELVRITENEYKTRIKG